MIFVFWLIWYGTHHIYQQCWLQQRITVQMTGIVHYNMSTTYECIFIFFLQRRLKPVLDHNDMCEVQTRSPIQSVTLQVYFMCVCIQEITAGLMFFLCVMIHFRCILLQIN